VRAQKLRACPRQRHVQPHALRLQSPTVHNVRVYVQAASLVTLLLCCAAQRKVRARVVPAHQQARQARRLGLMQRLLLCQLRAQVSAKRCSPSNVTPLAAAYCGLRSMPKQQSVWKRKHARVPDTDAVIASGQLACGPMSRS